MALRTHTRTSAQEPRRYVCRRRSSGMTSGGESQFKDGVVSGVLGRKTTSPDRRACERSPTRACVRVRSRAHERFRSVRSEKPSTGRYYIMTARTHRVALLPLLVPIRGSNRSPFYPRRRENCDTHIRAFFRPRPPAARNTASHRPIMSLRMHDITHQF